MTPETMTILSALRADHEAAVRLHQQHLNRLTFADGIRRVLHLHAGTWSVVRDGQALVVLDDEGGVRALRCPCCGGDRLEYQESMGGTWELGTGEGMVRALWDGVDFHGKGDGMVFCLTPNCDASRHGFTVPDVEWGWS